MDEKKVQLLFQALGGILGIVAFLWNLINYLWTYIFSHLQIDFSNEKVRVDDNEKLKVTTIVENKGSIAKKIDYAFLLIKPDTVNFKNSLIELTRRTGHTTKDPTISGLLYHLHKSEEELYGKFIEGSFAIYPLPYYYDEQFQIGNERVKYSCIIDLQELQKGKVYNIRFVTISYHLFGTYLRFRTTSDLFIN